MKPGLQVGHRARLNRLVDNTQSITIGSQPAATVFATPSMIHLMEYAAREVLLPFLDATEDSVGIDVQVEHTAATPLGSEVYAEAEVTAIEKNVIAFAVEAFDQSGKIGAGTHRRAVIKTEKFAERLAEKTSSPPARELDFSKFERLKVESAGGVLSVTLKRPEKRNAIDSLMTSELELLTEWLRSSDVRVVQFRGDEQAFSAGDDVLQLEQLGVDGSVQLSRRRSLLYQRWQGLPQVLIAAIEGRTFGGGFILAASCDFRLASHSAIFGVTRNQTRLVTQLRAGSSRSSARADQGGRIIVDRHVAERSAGSPDRFRTERHAGRSTGR